MIMMLAEKNYGYQRERRHYKTDVKLEKVERSEQVYKKNSSAVISSKDKLILLALTLFVGLLCVGLILTTAYAAKVKYNINNLTNENAVITGEIEALNVKIKTGTNLQTIEQKAISEIGMVYPTPDQFVFVDGKKPAKDFALALKEQAYN